MKKLIAVLLMLFFSVPLYAAIDEIIFFGDSLSDNGNIYKLLQIPKHPYFQGRFSNGYTWAEHLSQHYYQNPYYVSSQNFAFGGATAAIHNPIYNQPLLSILLETEINGYLLNSLIKDKRNILYSIWIGGNDYMFNTQPDMDDLTDRVVAKITQGISTLIFFGGKSFLVINLPDLAMPPGVDVRNSRSHLHALTLLHNQKLYAAIEELKHNNPDVNIIFIDAYKLLNDLTSNKEQNNQKYQVHLKNFSDACWPVLPLALTNYSANNNDEPEKQPCMNADEYLFWDMIHPSAITHLIISKLVIERLTAEGLEFKKSG